MALFAGSMRRRVAATAAAAILTMLIASTAFAGGWASATLDSQPDDPGAGGTVVIGFTLLQHGVTPVDWGKPQAVLVDQETGQQVTAMARPDGAKGHWVAELNVPAAGSWQLEIRHDLDVVPVNFAPITVGGVQAAAPAEAPDAAALTAQPAVMLAIAFLGLLVMATIALGTLAWRRMHTGQTGI